MTNLTSPTRPSSTAEAADYASWAAAAKQHDESTGAAKWRRADRSRRYDYENVRRRFDELRALNATNDPHALLFYLNEGIHGNVGGMGQPGMYNRARFGTKDLITNYIAAQAQALEIVARADTAVVPFRDKLEFFRRVSLCFGRSALMFSGGGALGPFHLGVVKALLEQGLLPTVISGASAGSFIAAVLGTHTDEELRRLLDPSRLGAAMGALVDVNAVGGRRDQISLDHVQSSIATMIPDLTFQEAAARTGRKINISVSPAKVHQTSRLLNAITSPNVFIREAVQASAAIPGVFPAVTLAAKNRAGERQPYLPGSKWTDGSLTNDLPASRLARLYGVNHFITSLINPLVLSSVRDTGFDDSLMARLADVYQSSQRALLRATYPFAMDLVKGVYPLNLLTRMAYDVGVQDYTADINIIPRQRFWDPRKLLSVLSDAETRSLIREGELATWPKIEMIRNCTLVGRTLDRINNELEREAASQFATSHENRDYVEADWSPH